MSRFSFIDHEVLNLLDHILRHYTVYADIIKGHSVVVCLTFMHNLEP